ncbi:lipid IV(A) 3-deoxy-D-manno-octulosonic acid transferase [uncultured Vibrio sp.]|uniref:lipid IV(A) 3-deoxy-D-manno-octulosonic acid transferase n=1 Tax=uncultured Vibrio sp. TaxID=114054 RepID=UPI0025DF3A1D|nr:lipid IV(A) 3-deoxy-D-manno-octulosonic acid transferase [uncultured Vibrio sp.]
MIKIVLALYSFALFLALPIILPLLMTKRKNKPAIGSRWKEYFGSSYTCPNATGALWIHAVSVGEVIAASPLISQLKNDFPNREIIVTTTTTTGAEQVKKLRVDVIHCYMPLDFKWAIRAFLKATKPSHLFIMETELWPNTLTVTAAMGVTISILNARLSEKSFRSYQRFNLLFKSMISNVSLIVCQAQSDASRFLKLGVSTDSIALSGSIKYDLNIDSTQINNAEQLRATLGENRQCWLAASTHKGEDEIIINLHKKLKTKYPELFLVLVPRHPERFEDVFKLSHSRGFKTINRSAIDHDNSLDSVADVVIGNTMGEMQTYIQMCDFCFMGGSLVGSSVGGHNVLEPAALGKPVITGPSYYNFSDITEILKSSNGLFIANNEADIYQYCEVLLSNPALAIDMGLNAQTIFKTNQGATGKTIDLIKSLIEK